MTQIGDVMSVLDEKTRSGAIEWVASSYPTWGQAFKTRVGDQRFILHQFGEGVVLHVDAVRYYIRKGTVSHGTALALLDVILDAYEESSGVLAKALATLEAHSP